MKPKLNSKLLLGLIVLVTNLSILKYLKNNEKQIWIESKRLHAHQDMKIRLWMDVPNDFPWRKCLMTTMGCY